MDLILKFTDIDASMLPLVGGKAANLGVMTNAGLPVPPGICLTTEAYTRVTEHAGLDVVLAELRAAFRTAPAVQATPATPATLVELAALAARAREIVLNAPVPDDIADVIRAAADGP